MEDQYCSSCNLLCITGMLEFIIVILYLNHILNLVQALNSVKNVWQK